MLFLVQSQTPLSLATQFQFAGLSGLVAASIGAGALCAGFCTDADAMCEQSQVPLVVALQFQFSDFCLLAVVIAGTLGLFAASPIDTVAFCEQSQVPLFVALQSQSPEVFASSMLVVFLTVDLVVIS